MEKGLTFEYDEHADVLYISVGTPKPAISEEVDEGIIFRRDPRIGTFYPLASAHWDCGGWVVRSLRSLLLA